MRFSEMVFKSLFARIESMTSVYRASTSWDTVAQGMMSVKTEFGAYTQHRMAILRDMSSKSFDFLFFHRYKAGEVRIEVGEIAIGRK
jgi:hypothetical protein